MSEASLYRRVTRTAQDPPGGVPEGWGFLRVHVYGEYEPHRGEWWKATAEYGRCDQSSGTRRLIGAGPSVRAALSALQQRLRDPYAVRRKHAKGGWDTKLEPGQVVERP